MAQVLRRLDPVAKAETLLVGPDGFDDAGAVLGADGMVSLYTVDFFPPVVDDPTAYGAIAAANSLSDIYACGGRPKVVLNLAGFPADWGDETLHPIFDGAVQVVREAGALWVGGHSVISEEPLFGFAVFGEVTQDLLVTQQGAEPGDQIFLTKPLGAGSITTGVKLGRVSAEQERVAVAEMARLNILGGVAMRAAEVKAGTDVTGFGLLGHAFNMAKASGVVLTFEAAALPLYDGAAELAADGIFSGAANRGREGLGKNAEIGAGVDDWLAAICFDAETSGGILACVKPHQVPNFLAAMENQMAVKIGVVQSGQAKVVLA
ncbi:MAG: selenide, water dikinase SelD [Planctomycetes bacterium]|nr:selenide, water dikinase SelD [Planctomycetota bacterium]NQU48596.1 selenide, water dikinase SelD [Planctomycetota bacterium]